MEVEDVRWDEGGFSLELLGRVRSLRNMKRRSVLALLGAVGGSGWIGYERFQSGREGRVYWRQMAVDAGGEPGSLIILTESRESDGTVSHTIHDEYTDAFDDGTYVSKDLHRALEREFGSDEPYYLVRYEKATTATVSPAMKGATLSKYRGRSLTISRSAAA